MRSVASRMNGAIERADGGANDPLRVDFIIILPTVRWSYESRTSRDESGESGFNAGSEEILAPLTSSIRGAGKGDLQLGSLWREGGRGEIGRCAEKHGGTGSVYLKRKERKVGTKFRLPK